MYGHTVITLLCKYVMSLTTNLSTMCFLLLNNVLIEEVKQKNLKFLKVGSCPNDENSVQIFFFLFCVVF